MSTVIENKVFKKLLNSTPWNLQESALGGLGEGVHLPRIENQGSVGPRHSFKASRRAPPRSFACSDLYANYDRLPRPPGPAGSRGCLSSPGKSCLCAHRMQNFHQIRLDPRRSGRTGEAHGLLPGRSPCARRNCASLRMRLRPSGARRTWGMYTGNSSASRGPHPAGHQRGRAPASGQERLAPASVALLRAYGAATPSAGSWAPWSQSFGRL